MKVDNCNNKYDVGSMFESVNSCEDHIHGDCDDDLIHSVTNIRIFEYIRIFSATNIRSYHIHILFLIRIYSDIRSYCFFFNTNIFGYSFVSKFHIRHTMVQVWARFVSKLRRNGCLSVGL